MLNFASTEFRPNANAFPMRSAGRQTRHARRVRSYSRRWRDLLPTCRMTAVRRSNSMRLPELPLSTPSLLFPAISLLMLAYTNRFLGLATVFEDCMRTGRAHRSRCC